MNRNLLLIAFVMLFSGCVSDKGMKEPKNITEQTNLSKFAKNFKEKHQNWSQNSVIEDKTNILFADSLDKFLSTKDALSGYSFKVESINEYQKGKYAVKLVNDDNFNIELVGLINDSLVNVVKENGTYSIKGSYIKNLQQLKPYYNYGMWNVSIGRNSLVDTSKIYLGVNLFKIQSLN